MYKCDSYFNIHTFTHSLTKTPHFIYHPRIQYLPELSTDKYCVRMGLCFQYYQCLIILIINILGYWGATCISNTSTVYIYPILLILFQNYKILDNHPPLFPITVIAFFWNITNFSGYSYLYIALLTAVLTDLLT